MENRGFLANALHFHEKLAGGTRAFVWLRGSLRLKVRLDLLGVSGRSNLSIVGGHLGTVWRVLTSYPVLCKSSQQQSRTRVEGSERGQQGPSDRLQELSGF